MRIALPLLSLAFLAAVPAPRWDCSTAEVDPGGFADYAPSRAICARVINAEPPAADRPTPAQTRALKGCYSEALYYGIGMKADPIKARLCAFTEKEEDVSEIGGRAMLMTIYANGAGVGRNLSVATHLACGIENSAPMEQVGRIEHLQKLKPGDPFDICDDITSGYMMGQCAGLAARIEAPKRAARLDALAASGRFATTPEWRALRKAADAYALAYSLGETDMTGTARGAEVVSAQFRARGDFEEALTLLVAGEIAPASPRTLSVADAALNQAYRAALADLDAEPGAGAVTREGMRGSARAWIAYRDAVLAFAARRFPAASRSGLAALLTRQRIANLSSSEE